MLDIKELRKDPVGIEKKLKNKMSDVSLYPILAKDEKIRQLKMEVEEAKARHNNASKEIGQKKQRGEDVFSCMTGLASLSDSIARIDQEIAQLESDLQTDLACIPNIPMDDAPVSPSAKDNVCIKSWGEKPSFDFPFKNHLELNKNLHLFDFERAAKLSGSGWPVYVNLGARLEWALINYMLDIQRKNGFIQIIPPLLVRPEIMFGSAHLPKFENQLFKINDKEFQLYLIPTSESALNGLHFDEILSEDSLPLKYTAYTPCFRREAGAAGSREHGLIRTHQFNKVEMFCFTDPQDSPRVYEQMLASAEEILQGLGLHYRNMLLTTGDMSFAAAKTIDVEVWLPGQDRYYEVSSISNCTDFQARRAQIRFRKKNEKPQYVHTLNGSGLATSRLMVALLENNQQSDGSVRIPQVLQRYLGNEITHISPSCLGA
jgi:seryl-tRNA synthetase